jgi:hypothetical protein
MTASSLAGDLPKWLRHGQLARYNGRRLATAHQAA